MAKKDTFFVDVHIRNAKNQKIACKSVKMDIDNYKEVVRIFKL